MNAIIGLAGFIVISLATYFGTGVLIEKGMRIGVQQERERVEADSLLRPHNIRLYRLEDGTRCAVLRGVREYALHCDWGKE